MIRVPSVEAELENGSRSANGQAEDKQAKPALPQRQKTRRMSVGSSIKTLQGHKQFVPSRPEDKLKAIEKATALEESLKDRAAGKWAITRLCQRTTKSLRQWCSRKLAEPANVVKLVALLCVLWIWVTTFAPEPVGLIRLPSGTLCPRVTVCAETWATLVLLGISRTGAYFCYPFIMLLFLTKTNHLRTYLQRTVLQMFIPFHDLHYLHVLAGRIVGLDITVHSCCHIARWALQGRADLLWSSQTGVSGFISFVLTPLIVLPMLLASLRKRMTWETRKGLHYLSIVWGFSICFHAPMMDIAWLVGVPLGMYVVDYIYGTFFRTYKIVDSTFTRLECGVELTFDHPPGCK